MELKMFSSKQNADTDQILSSLKIDGDKPKVINITAIANIPGVGSHTEVSVSDNPTLEKTQTVPNKKSIKAEKTKGESKKIPEGIKINFSYTPVKIVDGETKSQPAIEQSFSFTGPVKFEEGFRFNFFDDGKVEVGLPRIVPLSPAKKM